MNKEKKERLFSTQWSLCLPPHCLPSHWGNLEALATQQFSNLFFLFFTELDSHPCTHCIYLYWEQNNLQITKSKVLSGLILGTTDHFVTFKVLFSSASQDTISSLFPLYLSGPSTKFLLTYSSSLTRFDF
jgi:hypothetical protein